MISVCMATYNGAKYIKEQVDSILCQLSDEDELVVSDDGSTDDTLKILESYGDSRIKIFHHDRKFSNYNNHQKVSANFENAISLASGDWIFLSDQDDIWAPNKVERCSQYFDTHDLIVSDCCFIINEITQLETSILRGRSPKWSFTGRRPNYHGCCMAFRASFKSVILPFPEHLYVHDAWIGNLITVKGRTAILHENLVCYRIHDNRVSKRNKQKILYTISHRLQMLKLLVVRLLLKNNDKY